MRDGGAVASARLSLMGVWRQRGWLRRRHGARLLCLGHLHERFLKIMMIGREGTQRRSSSGYSRVLSPSFKGLPQMARGGFEYASCSTSGPMAA